MPVLKTRLYRPSSNRDLIHRDRLLSFLRSKGQAPVTLFISGAGYGKSVLIIPIRSNNSGYNIPRELM